MRYQIMLLRRAGEAIIRLRCLTIMEITFQRVHKDIVNCIQRILIKNKMGSGYALVVVFIKE